MDLSPLSNINGVLLGNIVPLSRYQVHSQHPILSEPAVGKEKK